MKNQKVISIVVVDNGEVSLKNFILDGKDNKAQTKKAKEFFIERIQDSMLFDGSDIKDILKQGFWDDGNGRRVSKILSEVC